MMKSTMLPAMRSSFIPWTEKDGFENRLKTLFEDPFVFGATPTMGWVPTVDVVETDDALVLTAELPGLDKDDVDIELEGNVLTLRGEKTDEIEKEGEKADRRMRIWERRYGEFSRSFTLPNTINADGIQAEFAKGVLTVHLPKTVEAQGRRIAITSK